MPGARMGKAPGLECVVPIRVRLFGEPTEEDLAGLEAAVARAVASQLAVAGRVQASRGWPPATAASPRAAEPGGAAGASATTERVAERFDLDRGTSGNGEYDVNSFDGGALRSLPMRWTPEAVSLPPQFAFSVQEAGDATSITYQGDRTVAVIPTKQARQLLPGRRPYAYELVPPALFERRFAIIRLVAGPGVRIQLSGFPKGWFVADQDNPLVQIIRVQDPEQIPPQGAPIDPSSFAIAEQPGGLVITTAPGPLVVRRRPDGVDLFHTPSGTVLHLTAPSLSPDARFAYQIVPPTWQLRLAAAEIWTVNVVKTPAVELLVTGPRGVITGLELNVYEVPSITEVPAQGQPITPVGRTLTELPAHGELSVAQEQAIQVLEAVISLVPVVGTLYNLAEFAYGAATGRDFWGRPLTTVDVALLGLGALLPYAGTASRLAARGVRAVRAAMTGGEELARLLRAVEALSTADRAHVERWNALIRAGQQLPAGEKQAVLDLVRRLDAAATAAGKGEAAASAAVRGAAGTAAGTAEAVATTARRARRLQGRFMREALETILADESHPLRFLVDPKTRRWLARTHMSELPTVQAGHLVSFHSGAAEALALEDSFFNQVTNWKGERFGAVFEKAAVEIGGVPVEVRTAEMWESLGVLQEGTVERAMRSAGWTGLP